MSREDDLFRLQGQTMLKRLKEWFTGWSDDKYCRVCGAELTTWGAPSSIDPVEGTITERATYKTCPTSFRHVWYVKYTRVR